MIPEDRDELKALAGEYVLGVLDPGEAREIAAALATNDALRGAVAFWEAQLHPLAALAQPAEPPADLWNRIAGRLDETPPARAPRWWNRPAPWRWATGGLAAVAAALLLYIALAPASYVAVLHAPQQDQASWVATVGRDGLTLRTVAAASPPAGRAFELWAIAPGAAAPQALGVIPADGVLRVSSLPADVRLGATLAISVEPPGGAPNQHQPTGPVVFNGPVEAL
ncbi:MAG TPA: anti-sigma factor [Stellaceae bacterium]|nr:anti-sigma factor [Stellaceae bacterium]